LFYTFDGIEVFRKTLYGTYDFIENDLKSSLEGYRETLKDFLKELKKQGVEKVYLIPPLPLYRGLATKEEHLREIYFSDTLEGVYDELPFKLVFSSFGIVYTPELRKLKKRLVDFLTKNGIVSPKGKRKRKSDSATSHEELLKMIYAVNLFKNIEKLTPRSGAFPFVIPIFAIIPLFSMEEGKKESLKKTLFHHAFVYSVPNHQLFEGLNLEMIFLPEEDKRELANLLSVVHLIQFQKWEELKSQKLIQKTFKRNPFYVFPERRSGDKNILALTEVEIFFRNELRPKWQTVLTAFKVWDAVKNP